MHHITFRSRGGDDSMENIITLCAKHHDQAHRHQISPEELTEVLAKFLQFG